MKALALGEVLGLLAVALVAGPAEGLVLTKCEMKAELEAMLPDMDEDDDGMKGPFKMEDILAKIICKIEFTTQFNTSQVTVMDPPKPLFPGRKPWPPRRPSVGVEGSGSAGQGEGEPVPKPENPEAPADKPERPVRRPWGRPFGRPWSPLRWGKRAVMPRFRPMGGSAVGATPAGGQPGGARGGGGGLLDLDALRQGSQTPGPRPAQFRPVTYDKIIM
ncbi:hypothetical protein AALO_G00098800 [Alosa alosa]|uniref:Uncharacterized protein n=1 Tax=Alosa alosa TaxID=278164 RepID=A0AAV6GXF2_9TELE|nr:formin-like protein 18 [Alosa alosa]KAG5278420.1 hypothetical protein AALO_G00098800 [Alosa alosa]